MSKDVLSDVLARVRATGTVYFCEQLQVPWKKHFPASDHASFHQVRRGGCRLETEGLTQLLGPGDLVFLAPGREHYLSADPAPQDQQSQETFLLCGYCSFNNTISSLTDELFPDVVVMRDEQLQSAAWLKMLLDQLSHEYLSLRPGTDVVVNRLTEVFIVELVRINYGRQKAAPLMQALSDRHIGKALEKLHMAPEKPWALESLALDVGLSRAGFAKRFKELVGQSMFAYLTTLRMQQACQALSETDQPIYAVAQQVGYDSDLAFARTFKKRLGLTPTAYRKQANAET